ncbi:MAG: DUF1127 domain-containing protein [Rhodospirillales bacterium]|nr:DUF1127 domain-containing protein [Rhodospirillales bacterium]
MNGFTQSDLLLSTASTPKSMRSFAVEALQTRRAHRPETANGPVSKLFAMLRRARARRVTLDQLSALDDAALRDIGLEPGTLVETVSAVLEKREASFQQDHHGSLNQVDQVVGRNFKAVDKLQRLNDRLLADIGVSRKDIEGLEVDQRLAAANRNRAFFRAA